VTVSFGLCVSWKEVSSVWHLFIFSCPGFVILQEVFDSEFGCRTRQACHIRYRAEGKAVSVCAMKGL